MSVEYKIALPAQVPSLSRIAARIAELGLKLIESTDHSLALSKPGSDAEQQQRWGADVQVVLRGSQLELLINSVGLSEKVTEKIVQALADEGIRASAEEV